MSFAELVSLEQLIGYLEQHRQAAYTVLFLGAFFETLIPFSLAVLGELFFLSGALLAGMGVLDVWIVAAVLYAGGILGDNASYWIGRHYGPGLFDRLARWPGIGRLLHADNFRRGLTFFERHGALAVFSARLSGPLSWVMPALAGMFRLEYSTFLRFNTMGVITGIGQFLALGYFFGNHLETVFSWIEHFGTVLGAVICIGLSLVTWRYVALRRDN